MKRANLGSLPANARPSENVVYHGQVAEEERERDNDRHLGESKAMWGGQVRHVILSHLVQARTLAVSSTRYGRARV